MTKEFLINGFKQRENHLESARDLEETLEFWRIENWFRGVLKIIRLLHSIPEYLSWIDPKEEYLDMLVKPNLIIKIGYDLRFHSENSFIILLETKKEFETATIFVPMDYYFDGTFLISWKTQFEETLGSNEQYQEFLRLKEIYDGWCPP